MKIYAKQISPEYQESPSMHWGLEELYPDVIFKGNRNFMSHTTPEFDAIESRLDDLTDTIDTEGKFIPGGWYENITEAVTDLMPAPLHKARYSTRDIKAWREIGAEWYNYKNTNALLCRALELITGKEYDYTTIRGCVQGDWQEIFYPAGEYNGNAIEILEADYFNTGTEWIIHDEDSEPEGAEDVSGYSLYCYGWNTDQIRAEIASAAEVDPEAVVMFEYAGSYSVPKYNKVGA